jgi:two-component system sensor histidine kinase QseC
MALAFRNLHENAVQHTAQPGLVRWALERRAGEIVVGIEDEGPGIPNDELPLVTRRFFRGRHKRPSGSGLGLAIAELALRANSARLNLVNRTDRSGLRAEIILPPDIKSLRQGDEMSKPDLKIGLATMDS